MTNNTDTNKIATLVPKITLRRKTISKLQITGTRGGVKKTVNVEVRKRRAYVRQTVEQKVMNQLPVEDQTKAVFDTPKIVDIASKIKTKSQQISKIDAIEKITPSTVPTTKPEQAKKSKPKRQVDVAAIKQGKSKKSKLRLEEKHRQHHLDASVAHGKDNIARRCKKLKFSKRPLKQQFEKPVVPQIREVSVPETISVSDLAKRMFIKPAQVIQTMMNLGTMVTINQIIDQDTAAIVVEEMGHKPNLLKESDLEIETLLTQPSPVEEKVVDRPPVVTIMGHVDHGKTTLLDYIRRTKVAASEAGGITQNIGAYHVETPKGMITFVDTPGHEAFTAMRARGAKFTDIVVLIVAADDGVMPQTVEAIQHARAAEVPIIVAVNKIDKPQANVDRIGQELAKYQLIPERWGGDNMFVNISAKHGSGIDELLEAILLQAEVLELKTVENVPAKGVVIEARLDRGRGVVATVLVQRGTLRKGDVILTGLEYGRIRAILDETGHFIATATPAIPVEILGLSGVPQAGDIALVVVDERRAREIALFRQGKDRELRLAQKTASLDTLFEGLKKGESATLNVVLKANIQGSVEALVDSLQKLSAKEVQVKIVASGVGGITESDVNLALASNAIIIAFGVRADLTARRLIQRESVDVHYHTILYKVIEEVKQALSGMLQPDVKEKVLGVAQVRQVFRAAKLGAIAGCMVIEGVVKRGRAIRVLRDSVVVYQGELQSLRRHKDDVNEVGQHLECGIGVKDYNDIKLGDLIEVYEMITVKRNL